MYENRQQEKAIRMNDYIQQMECNHDDFPLMMCVGVSHTDGPSYGDFCRNCNARLDGPHGIIHYNQKRQYRDRKKNGL